MYLFDPIQLQQFGSSYYVEEEAGFSYRYQKNTRLGGILRSRYIPYGPVCQNKDSLLAFFNHVNLQKLSKFRLDLPMIFDEEKKKEVQKLFENNGFAKRKYIQDGETILVYKKNYSPPSKTRQYIRKGKRAFEVEVKEILDKKELTEIYEIYLLLAQRVGFEPKSLDAFEVINQNALTSIAKNKNNKKIEGFLMGYKIGSVLSLIFTALTDKGLKEKGGYILHGKLFDLAFEKGIDIIDFHGADRSKGRTYISFKERWGNTDFVTLPGSYERVSLL